MAAGIKQVADLAGVSTATVSHVINNTRYVAEETKLKVFRAMKELDYRPNSAARSLRSQRSHTIGLIVPILPSDTSNFFFMTVAQGIQAMLKHHGYHLLLSNNTTERIEEEIEQIKMFNSKLIDGLIIASIAEDVGYMNELVRSEYPVVFIDRRPHGYEGDCVLSNGFEGSYNAVRTLIEKGHKKIGLITGALGITTSNERYDAYRKALDDYGIAFDESMVQVSESLFDCGYTSARELLQRHPVSAVFVTNNVLTMGVIQYVQEKQIRVPDELAIIGFDDYDWTKITNPPLSVIRQPSFELGEKAAEIILNRIASNQTGDHEEYRLPTTLVLRGSS